MIIMPLGVNWKVTGQGFDTHSKIFPLGKDRDKVPLIELVIFLDIQLNNNSPLPS